VRKNLLLPVARIENFVAEKCRCVAAADAFSFQQQGLKTGLVFD
jgi:hypothetical protein